MTSLASGGCADLDRPAPAAVTIHEFFSNLFVLSGISKWVCRDSSQEVCPWNVRFAQPNKVPEFAPREVIAGKDARTLARELLAMTQDEFSGAFRNSPMKRAKLRGLKRNALVVLGNIGDPEDADMLAKAPDDSEPLVRRHAARAFAQIDASAGS